MSEPETAFRAPLPEELATLFPKHQILSLIATGGMGAVYHAVQTSLEREVAIKILPVEFSGDPEFYQGFAAEAKAMAKLNHPNLIGVYDSGDVEGMLFIVMEYVSGQSLHEACNGSAIDPAEVIRLMTGICHGLAHAHAQGILHRDIKPGNILLDSQLQPKVGDFGLARPLDAKVGDGETIFGTPGYTAPEVLAPPHTVDQRADIFALGAVLHELLTGLVPGSDPRLPSAISRCDSRFDSVVQKATHPDPQLRYQNATEIAEALQKIASPAVHTAMGAVPPTAHARRPTSKVRSASKLGGGIMGLLLPFTVAALLLYYNKDRILNLVNPKPVTILLVKQNPAPVKADVETTNPDPVNPDPVNPDPVNPDPVNPDPVNPDPVNPEPGLSESVQNPVKPEPEPAVSIREPQIPEPSPLSSTPGSGTTNTPQPKFDVEGFLARARSVTATRCAPDIAIRDQALSSNLASFRRECMNLARSNLAKIYHDALESELDAYLTTCKANGNRLSEQLERPLKFKKWLVELNKEYQTNEQEIEKRAFVTHKNTYLQGLGMKINSLRKDDPVAADLIKDELDKVNNSLDYFVDLMQDAR